MLKVVVVVAILALAGASIAGGFYLADRVASAPANLADSGAPAPATNCRPGDLFARLPPVTAALGTPLEYCEAPGPANARGKHHCIADSDPPEPHGAASLRGPRGQVEVSGFDQVNCWRAPGAHDETWVMTIDSRRLEVVRESEGNPESARIRAQWLLEDGTTTSVAVLDDTGLAPAR